jgi:hypothetical protein
MVTVVTRVRWPSTFPSGPDTLLPIGFRSELNFPQKLACCVLPFIVPSRTPHHHCCMSKLELTYCPKYTAVPSPLFFLLAPLHRIAQRTSRGRLQEYEDRRSSNLESWQQAQRAVVVCIIFVVASPGKPGRPRAWHRLLGLKRKHPQAHFGVVHQRRRKVPFAGASALRAEGRHQLPYSGIAAAIAETGHLRSRAAQLKGIWRPCIAIAERGPALYKGMAVQTHRRQIPHPSPPPFASVAHCFA